MRDAILNAVTSHYLTSDRFNGVRITALERRLAANKEEFIENLEILIREQRISIVYGDYHPNPHIRALDDEPIESQIEKLRTEGGYNGGCTYPLALHLETAVNRDSYQGQPFKLELALGAPQLSFRYFDLSILEAYRNDPRYYYWSDDINGQLSISDEYYQTEAMPERDQVLLDTFGFGYDENMNRAVTSLLWYLSCLSPEHQQAWKAREVTGTYRPHPDYYRTNIIGRFPERLMIFDAFLEELKLINHACAAIGFPSLFRNDFENNKPREFSFLVRPTLRDYLSFVHLLDRMLSDNLNIDFFRGHIALDEEITRNDGRIEIRRKGTIRLLNEWIQANFRPLEEEDNQVIRDAIQILRDVRQERNRPGHAVVEEAFNQQYFQDQRALIKRAYKVVKTIRSILMLHPRARGVEISEYLENGLIWSY